MGRRALWAGALAVALTASTAYAQTPGDRVRIETKTGAVEGTLVDRVPDGYLVRVGEETRIVPYSTVKSVSAVVDAPPVAPAPPPPVAPVVVAPTPAPPFVVVVPRAEVVPPPPPPRSPGLVSGGKALTFVGAIGTGVSLAVLIVGVTTRSANQCHSASGDLQFQCEYGHGSDMVNGGIAGTVVGGAMMIGGLVMTTVGSVPRKDVAIPTVHVAPAGVTLVWAF